ncbi:MAG: hypothetical protein SPL57_02980 [Lachnospiraceae bacterium]|nr:hypothetical protein [Lachnospiraceae bacterium]
MNEMKREKGKKRILRILKGNNGGNSLVLVVVVMFVVMLLGLAILYSSYTSVILRYSQRKSEKTFSSAETGMELIREGLSEVNSDAIAAGYKGLLQNFSKDQDTNKATFANAYLADIVTSAKGDSGKILFPEAATGLKGAVNPTKYSVAALDDFLNGRISRGSEYKLSAMVDGAENSDTGSVYVTQNNDIILRGVRLVYKRNGYEEQITTDFRLTIPAASISSKYVGFNDALKNYNFIADQGLRLYRYGETGRNPANSTFEGSGYAGKVVFGAGKLEVNKNQTLIVGRTRIGHMNNDDTFVAESHGSSDKRTSGDISFATSNDPAGHIVLNEGSSLWVNNINLNKGSTLESYDGSHIYMRDDLDFGTGGTATLKGNYYGFGNGLDFDGKKSDSPMDSSSIIFNKKGTLDISNISSLTIAGKSFVTESSTATDKSSGMGSSITTRSEQLAYLVPDSFFATKDGSTDQFTNPRIISTADDEANDVSRDKALASIDWAKFTKKTDKLSEPLSYYGITGRDGIKVLTYNTPGNDSQCVRYYFLNFTDTTERTAQQNANAYFKDYFENNKEEVSSYISGYADLIGFDTKGASVRSAGTTIEGKEGKYNVIGGGTSSDDEAKTYNENYRKLSDTLNLNSDGNSTPFHTFIDVQKLHELCKNESSNTPVTVPLNNHVYDTTGQNDVVVGAYNGDLTYSGYSNGHYVLVVDGNVKISGNFEGIVLCSGTLDISVTDYMRIQNLGVKALKETDLWRGAHGSTSSSETNKWEDVTYENWKKD